jgi:glycosyltransferase involved in cell wall biosynthesis
MAASVRPSSLPLLTVVMAVHDGARHLPAQLASVRAQSVVDFVLLARDDGSRDDSWALLSRAAAEDPRILPSRVPPPGRGAAATFAALLAEVRTPFFALADQDDLWHPEHLRRGLEALAASPEADLTHSDLALVDEEGRPLGVRLWERLGLRPVAGRRPRAILLRNTVTGASVVARTRLLKRALPIPAGVEHHDWWLALAAASGGGLLPRPEPTVFYRQHAAQLLGARRLDWRSFHRRLRARGQSLGEHLRRRRRTLLVVYTEASRRFSGIPRGLIVFLRAPWPLRSLLFPVHVLVLALVAPEPGFGWVLREAFVNAWPTGREKNVRIPS